MDIAEIINSEEPVMKEVCGKLFKLPFFKGGEKERASQIAEHLKGLTIYEAHELLDKLSNALTMAANSEKIE